MDTARVKEANEEVIILHCFLHLVNLSFCMNSLVYSWNERSHSSGEFHLIKGI